MSTYQDPSEPIKQLLDQVQTILLQTWTETGFGHIEIDSERIRQDKVAVTLKGSTFYRYVIRQTDIEQCATDPSDACNHHSS
jgi:predicted nucleic acid-binding Zn ribbon protein